MLGLDSDVLFSSVPDLLLDPNIHMEVRGQLQHSRPVLGMVRPNLCSPDMRYLYADCLLIPTPNLIPVPLCLPHSTEVMENVVVEGDTRPGVAPVRHVNHSRNTQLCHDVGDASVFDVDQLRLADTRST